MGAHCETREIGCNAVPVGRSSDMACAATHPVRLQFSCISRPGTRSGRRLDLVADMGDDLFFDCISTRRDQDLVFA